MAESEPKPAVELLACDEGSEEHLMFCSIMEELEGLCQTQFSCFVVTGYTKTEDEGTVYEAKIRVADEAETPFVHCKVKKFADAERPPELQAFRKDLTEQAEFDFSASAVAAGANEEMKDEQPQGQSISGMVNQSEVTMIMEMGFSRNVAEKACFMVQGAGVERALGWIEDNRSAPDFEEPLMIVGQN